ncbi:hypothetical protein F5148DRAFT_276706 [Russula earlei]|uniref:Uncharacterized protein n=1 Tax=Russula earlei TaxID=71964 RepID=A0ACC0U3S3_9AGAM|nr:hypothetical protein F5148DRAFT_276706 [Russula earlei]
MTVAKPARDLSLSLSSHRFHAGNPGTLRECPCLPHLQGPSHRCCRGRRSPSEWGWWVNIHRDDIHWPEAVRSYYISTHLAAPLQRLVLILSKSYVKGVSHDAPLRATRRPSLHRPSSLSRLLAFTLTTSSFALPTPMSADGDNGSSRSPSTSLASAPAPSSLKHRPRAGHTSTHGRDALASSSPLYARVRYPQRLARSSSSRRPALADSESEESVFEGTSTASRSFPSPTRTHAHSRTPLPAPLGHHQASDPGHDPRLLSVPPCPCAPNRRATVAS